MAAKRTSRASRIAVGGTPEIAGALLAANLAGEGVGVVAPDGSSFRWTKSIDDPVVVDALACMRAIFGIEPDMAILDVRALACAEWTQDGVDALIGAAGSADLGAVEALSHNLAAGVRPEVHRPLAAMGGSVGWVVPYSPFSGGWDATRDLLDVPRRVWPVAQFRAEDARRFIAGRQIALAAAPALLPESVDALDDDVPTATWREHVREAFADAVGCAVLRSVGSFEAADLVPQLRDARIGLRIAEGRIERGDMVLDTAAVLANAGDDAASLLRAVRMFVHGSQAFLPPAVHLNADRAVALAEAAAVAACDQELFPPDLREAAAGMLAVDLEDVVASLPDDPRAMERFALYGAWRIPLGLQETFREIADRVRPEASLADRDRFDPVPTFSLTY